MRVLLTGATGFVGHALMQHLVSRGHEVIPIVRGEAGLPWEVRWDLGRQEPPTTLPGRIDAILHSAQSRRYRDFPADGAELFAVNTAATAALLDYAARAGASRFCLLSTGTVYEPFQQGLDEEVVVAPKSMLGASKLAAEVLTRPYASLFTVSILRLFTPYGPSQVGRLIPDIIGRVRDGRPVQLSADGEGMRVAPLYMDDLCKLIMQALDQEWRGTLNVAGPNSTTIRKVALAAGGLLQREPLFEIGSSESLNLVPPLDRLMGLFDLGNTVALEDGLRRVIAAM